MRQTIRYLLSLMVLFVAYFITARIGLSLGQAGSITSIWPPAGIALAAVLLYGYRLWPAIFVAVYLLSMTLGHPQVVAIGTGVANVLEILLGVYFLKTVHIQNLLNTVRDVVKLIIGGLLGTLVGATIGVYSHLIGGLVKQDAFLSVWWSWYIADFLGIIVFAPLIMVWASRLFAGLKVAPFRLAGFLVACIVLVLVSTLAFSGVFWPSFIPGATAYIVYPVLLWIASSYRQPGTVIALTITASVAVVCTIFLLPRQLDLDPNNMLLLLQRCLGVASITFLTVAAVIEERAYAQLKQLELLRKTVKLQGERIQLKKVSRTKDEFIAIASHQLRTPATVVKMHLGMLHDGMFGKLSHSQLNSVNSAYQSNDRLISMVNELLSVAQVDMNNVRLQKEDTELQSLVTRVIYHLDPKIEERRQTISFVHDEGTHIAKVDQGKMAMVLENLIDNASKYSEPGKKIVVGLFNRDSNRLDIEVRDQGVGISPKDQDKLFKKFSRINNALSDVRGGTGLGLYWVKKIVTLHGGDISVESAPGKGTVFTVRLKSKKPIFA